MAVHVKKCPLRNIFGRARPTTEFYIDGKPQIYCYGWIDNRTDDFMETCQACADWVFGEQSDEDFKKAIDCN